MMRLLRIVLICVIFLILVRHGFGARTRGVTLLGVAIVFAMAAVYELAARGLSERVMAWTIAGVMGACIIAYGLMRLLDPGRPPAQGPLAAGHLPVPANGCSAKAQAADGHHLLMIFGQDGVMGTGDGPFTPVRIGSCPALSLTRVKGGLVVDGFGYDADNNVVYRIRRNVFQMVLRGYLVADRSDGSVLKIVDENSRTWLTVSYLNTNTVRITGIFGCGDTKSVAISEDSVRIGGVPVSGGACKTLATRSQAAIVYQSRAD